MALVRDIPFSQVLLTIRLATSWRAELCDAGQMERIGRECKKSTRHKKKDIVEIVFIGMGHPKINGISEG